MNNGWKPTRDGYEDEEGNFISYDEVEMRGQAVLDSTDIEE